MYGILQVEKWNNQLTRINKSIISTFLIVYFNKLKSFKIKFYVLNKKIVSMKIWKILKSVILEIVIKFFMIRLLFLVILKDQSINGSVALNVRNFGLDQITDASFDRTIYRFILKMNAPVVHRRPIFFQKNHVNTIF